MPETGTTWAAPTAPGPVRGRVRPPGSKSVTNRALVLAAIADAPSLVRQPLVSRDTVLMANALQALGVAVDTGDTAAWRIEPGRLAGPARVDVGLAGTVLRFLPPVATLATGTVAFDGDPRARERPVGPLLAALRAAGAEIDDGGRGALPFTVRGTGRLPGGAVDVDGSASSQLVSGLLLAAPRWEAGVEVRHVGARSVPNAHHLAMTVAMLRARGVVVEADGTRRWRVAPGTVAARDETVEPDLSSAAPFLAAAVVTGGRVEVLDWPDGSHQPGAVLPELLAAFGASVTRTPDGLAVTGPDRVRGADLDLRDAGELTPVLAAVAAVAASPSRLYGVDYLRGHESDRLAALATELSGLGADVREEADGLRVVPARLHGGLFHAHDDHRLAMAAAVVGLVVPGVELDDVATTAKTFPEFDDAWLRLVSGGQR